MPEAAQTTLLPAREVVRTTPLATAANGLRYASFGYTEVPSDSLQHIVETVPPALAAALATRAYYFVPLAISEFDEAPRSTRTPAEPALEIARGFTPDLGDRATCHRSMLADGVDCTFISARLMQDRFALAFEFFINIGHDHADTAGVPRPFEDLVWSQAIADVRGETSQDAYEARSRAMQMSAAPAGALAEESPTSFTGDIAAAAEPSHPVAVSSPNGLSPGRAEGTRLVSLFASRESQSSRSPRPRYESTRIENGRADLSIATPCLAPNRSASEPTTDEQATYFEAAFADTLAIYMLSLALDLDYADLREREYPLLAAPALADRLRLAASLFPPAPGYEFSIRYRRRH